MHNKGRIGNFRLKYFKNVTDTLSGMMKNAECGDYSERLTAVFSKSQRFFSSRTKYFQIAICGLFQAGKSTTVNALLGGREISASSTIRGLRTSACNVYFFGGKDEYCRLKFITDEEICAKIHQVLHVDIHRKKLYNFQTREFLWHRIFELLNTENLEERKQIEQIALLISGMGYLISLRRKNENISVEEVFKYGKAPEDEIIRWSKIYKSKINQPSDLSRIIQNEFPIEEVLYPFITSIEVYINCDWLQKSNVCLVDVPGLSANPQDTLTAMKAIESADALIYIFTGAKEPSEYERQFIRRLQNVTTNIPVLFAVNQCGQYKPTILHSIKSLLKECGYPENLITYNALLACLAVQGQTLLEDNLDEITTNSLEVRAKNNELEARSVKEIWIELTANEVKKISKPDSKIISKNPLHQNSINIALNLSNLENIFRAVNDLHGCQMWQTAFDQQIAKPIAAHLNNLDKEIRAEIDRLNKFIADSEKIFNEHWNERYIKLNVHISDNKKIFQSTINSNWIEFISKNMLDSFAAIFPKLSFALTFICINGNLNLEHHAAGHLDSIFNEAFENWRKSFLNVQSNSPLQILINCASIVDKNNIEFLLKDISEDLNNNPRPLHKNEKMFEFFIKPLIQSAYSEGIDSRARENYFSAKNSWNPFIDKEARMKEAQNTLNERIYSTLQIKFLELEPDAIKILSKRPTGQARQIYAIANQWFENIFRFEEILFHNMRNSELRNIHQHLEGKNKLHACRLILEQLKSTWFLM